MQPPSFLPHPLQKRPQVQAQSGNLPPVPARPGARIALLYTRPVSHGLPTEESLNNPSRLVFHSTAPASPRSPVRQSSILGFPPGDPVNPTLMNTPGPGFARPESLDFQHRSAHAAYAPTPDFSHDTTHSVQHLQDLSHQDIDRTAVTLSTTPANPNCRSRPNASRPPPVGPPNFRVLVGTVLTLSRLCWTDTTIAAFIQPRGWPDMTAEGVQLIWRKYGLGAQ